MLQCKNANDTSWSRVPYTNDCSYNIIYCCTVRKRESFFVNVLFILFQTSNFSILVVLIFFNYYYLHGTGIYCIVRHFFHSKRHRNNLLQYGILIDFLFPDYFYHLQKICRTNYTSILILATYSFYLWWTTTIFSDFHIVSQITVQIK